MGPEEEFLLYDRHGSWHVVFQQICSEALRKHDLSYRDSKQPEFRSRNRYRDVSPYDHSRVRLKRNDVDYINASLVQAPEASRSYILTQGPLPHTSGHFWLMVWEQNSKAILMLNRIIEKQQIKCHQYFPLGQQNEGEDEMTFEDVGLKVIYVSERASSYNYTIRILHIQDLETLETKEIIHFHYTTWPDFHVPDSPCAFLEFLFAVRSSGALESDVGPPSFTAALESADPGPFVLSTPALLSERKFASGQRSSELMEMRQYRMGLIQTADQLRFSYLAIVEGAKQVLGVSSDDLGMGRQKTFGNDIDINDDEDGDGSWPTSPAPSVPPPVPPRLDRAVPHLGDTEEDSSVTWKRNNADVRMNGEPTILPGDPTKETIQKTRKSSHHIRRRNPEERRKKTAEQIARMKERQRMSKLFRTRDKSHLGPLTIGLSVLAVVGSYAFYKYFYN